MVYYPSGNAESITQWLAAPKVTHVAMESTRLSWKSVSSALEGHFALILANPFKVKQPCLLLYGPASTLLLHRLAPGSSLVSFPFSPNSTFNRTRTLRPNE
jgi:hypothetical protein